MYLFFYIRTISTTKLFNGLPMEKSSPSKTLNCSRKLSYLNILDIEISIALFVSLICMGSTNLANSQWRIYLVILISKKKNRIFPHNLDKCWVKWKEKSNSRRMRPQERKTPMDTQLKKLQSAINLQPRKKSIGLLVQLL